MTGHYFFDKSWYNFKAVHLLNTTLLTHTGGRTVRGIVDPPLKENIDCANLAPINLYWALKRTKLVDKAKSQHTVYLANKYKKRCRFYTIS